MAKKISEGHKILIYIGFIVLIFNPLAGIVLIAATVYDMRSSK